MMVQQTQRATPSDSAPLGNLLRSGDTGYGACHSAQSAGAALSHARAALDLEWICGRRALRPRAIRIASQPQMQLRIRRQTLRWLPSSRARRRKRSQIRRRSSARACTTRARRGVRKPRMVRHRLTDNAIVIIADTIVNNSTAMVLCSSALAIDSLIVLAATMPCSVMCFFLNPCACGPRP